MKTRTTSAQKDGSLNISDSTLTGKTPSAEEDGVIRLKAPDQLLNGPCGQII